MRWIDFEGKNEDLSALVRAKLIEPGLVMVATIRSDGSPRVSPVNPHVWDGDLCLSLASMTRKAADVRRDPRILVHNAVARWDGADGELKVRATARAETDAAALDNFAAAVKERTGWAPPPGTFNLYRLDIHDVTFIDRENRPAYAPDVTRWPS
ncbi:MAG TPA: pyridoxamine 5'-phosphate oxidase family protein [Micromonosporaceae bacterium]